MGTVRTVREKLRENKKRAVEGIRFATESQIGDLREEVARQGWVIDRQGERIDHLERINSDQHDYILDIVEGSRENERWAADHGHELPWKLVTFQDWRARRDRRAREQVRLHRPREHIGRRETGGEFGDEEPP